MEVSLLKSLMEKKGVVRGCKGGVEGVQKIIWLVILVVHLHIYENLVRSALIYFRFIP